MAVNKIYYFFFVGCEDIITENISVDNILSILSWSSEPHGSQWVKRQALQFMKEEILQIIHSSMFYELTKDHLMDMLCSDFLQVITSSFLISYKCKIYILHAQIYFRK